MAILPISIVLFDLSRVKCVCDAETLLVLISTVARESTFYFRKSKSKFKFARPFKWNQT